MKNLIYLSAAALAALSLAACSSDNDVAQDVNPTYDGKSVKTQFAINIGSGSQGTRMTADAVQNSGNFRGMTNIRIATLGTKTSDPAVSAIPTSGALTTGTVTSWIQLGEIDDGISTTASSKIYTDVNVKTGTDLFLFYGKAALSGTQGAALGYTNSSFGNDLANITFTSQPVESGLTEKSEASAIVAALNALYSTISATADDALKTTFLAGNGGSSVAVLNRVNKLLGILDDGSHSSLQTAIEALFTATDENAVNKVFSLSNHVASLKSNYTNFPGKYGMPDGSALLTTQATTPYFKYSADGKLGSVTGKKVGVNEIVYPCELMYYCASPVKASDTSVSTSTNWAATATDWKDNPIKTIGWNWSNYAWVQSTTKTVALENNINYGVARLASNVKAENSNLSAINADGTAITVQAGNCKLTGILVGGQPNSVGFNFLTKENEANKLSKVVYDPITSTALGTSASPDNYTLVFDNHFVNTSGTVDAQKVNFALEFLYDGGDALQGVDGIIYEGMKFYLIGQLDIDKKQNGSAINWSSLLGNQLEKLFPAYNNDRVFVQDFTTTANVNVKSLVYAYVGIPDLRASLMSFGLSVDLNWKSGLTFDVDIE